MSLKDIRKRWFSLSEKVGLAYQNRETSNIAVVLIDVPLHATPPKKDTHTDTDVGDSETIRKRDSARPAKLSEDQSSQNPKGGKTESRCRAVGNDHFCDTTVI